MWGSAPARAALKPSPRASGAGSHQKQSLLHQQKTFIWNGNYCVPDLTDFNQAQDGDSSDEL